MILFPAIDLKAGACVRLVRGEMASATVFNDDPAAQARQFAAMGFAWLHVVDLDGAFAGRSVNGAAVRAIRRAVDLEIQLGGGIRDRAAIDYWLAEIGIDRIVETSEIGAVELARRFADAWVAAIVYTDIARDGALTGADAAGTAGFAREVGLPVIASGGIAALTDIAALATRAADGIAGAICGRALYDGRIEPKVALRLAAGEAPQC